MNEAESMDRQSHGYYDTNGYTDPLMNNGCGENYYHSMNYNENNDWVAQSEAQATASPSKSTPAKTTKTNINNENTDDTSSATISSTTTTATQSPAKTKSNSKSESQSSEKKVRSTRKMLYSIWSNANSFHYLTEGKIRYSKSASKTKAKTPNETC